jgi:hypothetical protein
MLLAAFAKTDGLLRVRDERPRDHHSAQRGYNFKDPNDMHSQGTGFRVARTMGP